MINRLRLVFLTLLFIAPNVILAQTKLSDSDNGDLVQDYLFDQRTQLGFTEKDIEDFNVSSEFYSKNSGITYMYINQTFNGVKIYNAISTVAIKDGRVFNFANRVQTNISDKVTVTSPTTDVLSAFSRLNTELNLGATDISVEEIDLRKYEILSNDIVDTPIEVELVYVPVNDKLVLAWDITVILKDNSNWWSARIDATDNSIIEKHDMILTCHFDHPQGYESHSKAHQATNQMMSPLLNAQGSYNVYAYPVESPIHGDRSIATNSNSTEASPFGWHDINGVDGPEFTITNGNNVFAREDRDGNNAGGYSPDGTSTLNFDFPVDLEDSPMSYEDAAITNLFYWNNLMHDIYYQHGFDEASGNFQFRNYTGVGSGFDRVVADAQDGSGFNNANFATPREGLPPRMQMFLWVGEARPLLVNTGSLAGSEYGYVVASFGAPLFEDITGDLALANPAEACNGINNGSEIAGKIAIIRRGDCEFGTKVLEAENQGAIAVIMVNNVPGDPIGMAPGAVGDQVTIPSVMVNQTDGEALIAALENEAINATLQATKYIDGDFDNGIIAHEYGHGISNRLTGGAFNVNCLGNAEQMGEGWSDWFGLMVTMTDEDTAEQRRGIGTFPTGQTTDGVGIRPAPYSTSFTENGFTFGNSNSGVSQPHGVGFVYATALWDLTWAYIDKYGFDPDLFNGDGGNNRVMKLVIEGLKLQPCSPGFIDGRDSLLAADQALTGGADACMIWEVFAARGMGVNADQGNTNNRSDQVEDFTLPDSNDPTLANCSSLSTESFDLSTLRIYPNPTNSEIFIQTRDGLGKVNLSLVDLNGRVVLNKEVEIFDTFKLDISNLETGMYFLKLQSDIIDANHKIIKN